MRKGTVDIFPDSQFRLAHKSYGRNPHTPPNSSPHSNRPPPAHHLCVSLFLIESLIGHGSVARPAFASRHGSRAVRLLTPSER